VTESLDCEIRCLPGVDASFLWLYGAGLEPGTTVGDASVIDFVLSSAFRVAGLLRLVCCK